MPSGAATKEDGKLSRAEGGKKARNALESTGIFEEW